MNNNHPIKIAYLVSQYPATSHTFILREVQALRKLNFDISVASINDATVPEDLLLEDEKKEVERTFYVKKKGLKGALISLLRALFASPLGFFRGLVCSLSLGGWNLKYLVYYLFYFIEALIIGHWMQRNGIDHLHVHFGNPASTVALILSKTFSHTFSITVHGPDIFDDVTLNKLRKKVAAAKFVFCIGYFSRSQLMRISTTSNWDKFDIAPLGADMSIFCPRPFREVPSPIEILCVGRLVPAKGQHTLLHAIRLLADRGEILRLRLIGDGPDRASLVQRAKELGITSQVVFEGATNQARVLECYKTADIFALASYAEGIPVVLMEAMAMEIPSVATYVNGIPELIRDNIDGLLVAPSDSHALANALGQLIDDPTYRLQLGQAGRKRILEKYDLGPNTVKLAKLFRRRLTRHDLTS